MTESKTKTGTESLKDKKPVKHRTKLNQRQRVFTSQMVKNGGNVNKSLVSAGYAQTYANGSGKLMLHNEPVKQDYERKFLVALKKAGVDDEKLSRVLSEGLDANKVFTFQGEVIESAKPVPDHFIRQKFVDTAAKVRGDFAPEQHEHSLKAENAEEAFRQRIQRRRKLEAKASGDSDEKPLEVVAEVVDEDLKEPKKDSAQRKEGEGSRPPTPSEI